MQHKTQPASNGAVTLSLCLYSAWTLGCNIFMLAGLSFNALCYATPVLIALGAGLYLALRPTMRENSISPTSLRALYAIGLVVALVTYIAHRPDLDDGAYANFAQAAALFGDQPIFKYDILHGYEGLPLYLPFYKFDSYELLIGLIAKLTFIPSIYVMHVILPLLIAFLSVFCFAALYRRFLPHDWLRAVIVHIGILFLLGQTYRSYGNFAYVRIFEGKSVFVTLMIPLIWWATAEFFRERNWRRWVILVLTQISSVGLTANAMLLAPLALFIMLLGELAYTRGQAVKQAILASASIFYPLGLTLLTLLVLMPGGIPELEHDDNLQIVFGHNGYYVLHLLVIGAAWLFARDLPMRRRLLTVGLVTLFLISPVLEHFWSTYVTVHHNWRLLWAVPFVTLATCIFMGAISYFKKLNHGSVAIVILLIAAAISPSSTLSDNNRTYLSFYPLKLLSNRYQVARELAKRQPDQVTLIPTKLAPWLVLADHHPRPLIVRWTYFKYIKNSIPEDDWKRLFLVELYIEGVESHEDSPEQLQWVIKEYAVKSVLIPSTNSFKNDIARTLAASGFGPATLLDDQSLLFFERTKAP